MLFRPPPPPLLPPGRLPLNMLHSAATSRQSQRRVLSPTRPRLTVPLHFDCIVSALSSRWVFLFFFGRDPGDEFRLVSQPTKRRVAVFCGAALPQTAASSAQPAVAQPSCLPPNPLTNLLTSSALHPLLLLLSLLLLLPIAIVWRPLPTTPSFFTRGAPL